MLPHFSNKNLKRRIYRKSFLTGALEMLGGLQFKKHHPVYWLGKKIVKLCLDYLAIKLQNDLAFESLKKTCVLAKEICFT